VALQYEHSDAKSKEFLTVFQTGFDCEAEAELRGAVAKSNARAIRIASGSKISKRWLEY
jgi:hypothetical protein